MKRHRYNINNLDCANCAKRVEDALNKNKDLKNVSVNFSTATISYESDVVELNEINKLVGKIEAGATVTSEVSQKKEYHLWVLIVGILLTLIGLYVNMSWYFNEIFIILGYIVLLYKTFLNAIVGIFKNHTINENTLITISCIGAYLVNQKMEGAMVVSLYVLGKILEEKAINNTRNSIKSLMDIKQDYANLIDGSVIDVEDIKIGDLLLVKKGEKVPVDGVVTKGSTYLNTSSLTGEADPLLVKVSSLVLSGSINNENNIVIKATSLYKDSTVARILTLTEEATDKKAKTETIVARVSKVYTPAVLILAILTAFILPLFSVSVSDSIYRALTFLVISCPCAIAISVPLSYFTGIGVSSKNGILIKGSNYLDNLSSLKKIIFDKTGTLTNGSFSVTDIEIIDKSYSRDEIINILVKGESLSNHPIAKGILKLTDKKINNKDVSDFKEISGSGISFTLNNKKVLIGNSNMCNCSYTSNLHLNIDGVHVASISLTDGIKPSAFSALKKIQKFGIKTYMFTGDKKDKAIYVGKKLSFDDVKYSMLPVDKYKAFEEIKGSDITAFVGDGINDAPVLKRADIGISMGSIGQASAVEASDIVIIDDDLNKIPLAIKISLYTKKIIKENLIFALGIKLLILVLSILGYANMIFAVFADTGVTLLVILNTLRILGKKY